MCVSSVPVDVVELLTYTVCVYSVGYTVQPIHMSSPGQQILGVTTEESEKTEDPFKTK